MNCKFVRVLIFPLLVLAVSSSLAQISDEPFQKSEGPTKNVDNNARIYHSDHSSERKQIKYLITTSTKGTLSGNRCVTDVTHGMGFEYLALSKGDPGYENGWMKFTHNLGVKSYLFFTKGPLWKSKVRKRIAECRYKTGDYAG